MHTITLGSSYDVFRRLSPFRSVPCRSCCLFRIIADRNSQRQRRPFLNREAAALRRYCRRRGEQQQQQQQPASSAVLHSIVIRRDDQSNRRCMPSSNGPCRADRIMWPAVEHCSDDDDDDDRTVRQMQTFNEVACNVPPKRNQPQSKERIVPQSRRHRRIDATPYQHAWGKKRSGWTMTAAMAMLLATNSTIAHAFSNQQRLYRTTLSLSSVTKSVDRLDDVDTSKLPRLFVGNSDRTRRVSSHRGITAAFQEALITKPSSPATRLAQDAIVPLNNDQSRYLTTVLRLGKKSKSVPYVRLFDDGGEEWLAEIPIPVVVGSKRSSRNNSEPLQAVCIQRTRCCAQPEMQTACWLVVAPTKKKDRMKWMIEKCTELNVAGFVLLDSEYSEAPSSWSVMSKLQAYAVEAAEQSERLSVPVFVRIRHQDGDAHNNKSRSTDGGDELSTTLEDFVSTWQMDTHKVSLAICRERSDQAVPLGQYLSSELQSSKVVAFVVGPEGGWSPTETEMFDNLMASNDASAIQAVSLGSTILRSETACILAVGAFALETDKTKRPSKD